MVQLSQLDMITGKTLALTLQTFVYRVMCLLFNTEICHNFPAKKQLSSDFAATVTIHSDFRAQEEEICHYFHIFPFYFLWSNRARFHDFSLFLIFSFKLVLSLSTFNLIKRLFSSSSLSAIRVALFALSEVVDVSPTYLDSSW